MTVLADLLTDTDIVLNSTVNNIYYVLSAPAVSIWTGAALLMVIFYGIMLLLGKLNEVTLYVTGIVIFKFLFVYALITSWGVFSIMLFNLFTNSSEAAGNIVLSATAGNTSNVTSSIDKFYTDSAEAAANIMDSASTFDLSAHFYGGFVYVGAFLVSGYSVFLIILSKIAVALLLALAPLFVLFALFQNTRGFFEGWLRQLLNYALIPLFIYTLLAFILQLSTNAINDLVASAGTGGGNAGVVMPYVLVCLICFLLMTQIMNIVSGITGGFALSSGGTYASMLTKPYKMAAGLNYRKKNERMQRRMIKAQENSNRTQSPAPVTTPTPKAGA